MTKMYVYKLGSDNEKIEITVFNKQEPLKRHFFFFFPPKRQKCHEKTCG